MKITIEGETDKEKEQIKTAVYEGVERFALAGRRVGDKPDFGYVHGQWVHVKSDVLRMQNECDVQAAVQYAMEGTLKAHTVIAQAKQEAAIIQQARNGGGMRIARP